MAKTSYSNSTKQAVARRKSHGPEDRPLQKRRDSIEAKPCRIVAPATVDGTSFVTEVPQVGREYEAIAQMMGSRPNTLQEGAGKVNYEDTSTTDWLAVSEGTLDSVDPGFPDSRFITPNHSAANESGGSPIDSLFHFTRGQDSSNNDDAIEAELNRISAAVAGRNNLDAPPYLQGMSKGVDTAIPGFPSRRSSFCALPATYAPYSSQDRRHSTSDITASGVNSMTKAPYSSDAFGRDFDQFESEAASGKVECLLNHRCIDMQAKLNKISSDIEADHEFNARVLSQQFTQYHPSNGHFAISDSPYQNPYHDTVYSNERISAFESVDVGRGASIYCQPVQQESNTNSDQDNAAQLLQKLSGMRAWADQLFREIGLTPKSMTGQACSHLPSINNEQASMPSPSSNSEGHCSESKTWKQYEMADVSNDEILSYYLSSDEKLF